MTNYNKLDLSDGSYIILNDDGKIHNDIGPAVYNNKNKQYLWIINGKQCSFKEWADIAQPSREILIELIMNYGV